MSSGDGLGVCSVHWQSDEKFYSPPCQGLVIKAFYFEVKSISVKWIANNYIVVQTHNFLVLEKAEL